jgi:hypothetical protein
MSFNNVNLNNLKNESSYVVIVFIGSGAGALLGLIAYVKDWF